MYVIFDPRTQPMLGMRSSIDPMAARPGDYASLVNLVGNRFKVTKRWGCDLIGASRPFAGSKYRGDSGLITMSNSATTPVVIFAFEDPGVAVRLYSLNMSTFAWVELTAVGTRFSTLANVQFTVAKDPATGNYFVIAGNGTEVRTVIGTSVFNAGTAPSFTSPFTPISQHWPNCWFNIQNPANTSYPTMTGAFTAAADSGASTDDNEIDVTMDTSTSGTLAIGVSSASRVDTVEEDYELFTGSGEFQMAIAGAGSRHFAILVEDTIADPVFNYLNVQVRNNLAATKDIFVQSTIGTIKPLYLSTDTAGVYLVVFDLSLYLSDLSNYPSLDRLILSVYRPLPAGRSFSILGIYGLGNIPAGAKHAVGMTHTSLVESGSIIARKSPKGPEIRFLGGNKLRNTTLPEGAAGQNVDWYYYVTMQNPGTGNTFYLYRKDPAFGEIAYYRSHGYAALTPQYKASLDTTLPANKRFELRAPSATNVGPPAGPAMTSSGGRTFIQNGASTVNISDLDYPLRFAEIPRDDDLNGEVDDASGTVAEFPGETIKKLLPLPNIYAGFAPVLCWTNKALWVMEGPDPLSWSTPGRLNPHGTLYPATVTTHKNYVYYLDAEKQPRAYSGGRESLPLGIYAVEDQFEDGDCWNACGWVWRESYNIAFRAPSGTLNKKILRYESETKSWWGHLYTSPNFASVFVHQTEGTVSGSFSTAHGSKMVGVSEEGFVFQIEKPGQLQDENTSGVGEDITIEIKKWLQGDGLENYFFRFPCIIWEESAGGTLTGEFITPQDLTAGGASTTGTVDMDLTVPDEVWRFFQRDGTDERPGVKSYGTFLKITGNPISGKFCRGIGLGELRPCKGGGGDRP